MFFEVTHFVVSLQEKTVDSKRSCCRFKLSYYTWDREEHSVVLGLKKGFVYTAIFPSSNMRVLISVSWSLFIHDTKEHTEYQVLGWR